MPKQAVSVPRPSRHGHQPPPGAQQPANESPCRDLKEPQGHLDPHLQPSALWPAERCPISARSAAHQASHHEPNSLPNCHTHTHFFSNHVGCRRAGATPSARKPSSRGKPLPSAHRTPLLVGPVQLHQGNNAKMQPFRWVGALTLGRGRAVWVFQHHKKPR